MPDSAFLRRFLDRVSPWFEKVEIVESLCGHTRKLGGTLRPQSVDEVQTIAEAASDAAGAVGLQPVSCGNNWGFGSRLPVVENVFLVDLSKLNRIRSREIEGHSVEIEPGVTQGQLDAWLATQGRSHFFNVTGAGTATSVIGNALEKGIGYSGPRQNDLLELEVILPDGRLLRTTKYPRASVLSFGLSLGPELVPLFCQGNFGIITAARIGLSRRPEKMGAVLCKLRDSRKLASLVDATSEIMAEGLSYGVPHIFNRARIITSFGSFLDEEGVRELKRTAPAWTALIPIKGPGPIFDATAKELENRLGPLGEIEISGGLVDAEPSKLSSLIQGRPNDFSLASVTYAVFGKVADIGTPLGDTGAGLIHVAPCLPLTGERVREGVRLAEDISRTHGREHIALSLNVISSRAVALVVFIAFDRRSVSNSAAAQAMARELLASFAERGMLPYRLGLNQADVLPKMSDTATEVLSAIQMIFDPNQCMAPSRYEALWTIPHHHETERKFL